MASARSDQFGKDQCPSPTERRMTDGRGIIANTTACSGTHGIVKTAKGRGRWYLLGCQGRLPHR
jgi:hypothetical protein